MAQASVAGWLETAKAFRVFAPAKRERMLFLLTTVLTTKCAARVAQIGRTSVGCTCTATETRRVCGRMKYSTVQEVIAQIDQVGPIANHVIRGSKFSHLGQDYPMNEKKEASDALDAGLAELKASSAATGGAPTEDHVPRKHTLGVMLAEKLTNEFYADLKNGTLWEDGEQRRKLRKNLKAMFQGFEVTTPEGLHSGKYAERGAVESDTAMLRRDASLLAGCYDEQFELGTDEDAMRAAVTRAATNVLPQMWLEAYDAVRPSPTPCVRREEKHDTRGPLGDRCTGLRCMMHVCRARRSAGT